MCGKAFRFRHWHVEQYSTKAVSALSYASSNGELSLQVAGMQRAKIMQHLKQHAPKTTPASSLMIGIKTYPAVDCPLHSVDNIMLI